MKLGLGILVLYLTVYTAKSLYVPNDDESAKVMQHQKFDMSIGVPEISINLLPTTRPPSILNKLISKAQTEAATTTPKQHLDLKEILSMFDSKFPHLMRKDENDHDNEISDIVEIEVPLVGNEFAKNYRVDADRINKDINADGESEEVNNKEIPEGYVDITIAPTTTEVTDFQSAAGVETTFENLFETSSSRSQPKDISNLFTGSFESKLMDHWSHLENVGDDFSNTKPTEFYSYGKKPRMNVKIYVNQKKKIGENLPCKQIRFARKLDYDVLPEYAQADSDEDLFFQSDPKVYFAQKNQLKSRRAADGGGFFSSITNLTPAPRNAMPNVNFPAIKKPSFLERLESESSVERSERVNKDLGSLMKFVAVWSHVDKFLSDRARSIVKKIAYLGDDEYGDQYLGSARKSNVVEKESLKNSMNVDNEPFT